MVGVGDDALDDWFRFMVDVVEDDELATALCVVLLRVVHKPRGHSVLTRAQVVSMTHKTQGCCILDVEPFALQFQPPNGELYASTNHPQALPAFQGAVEPGSSVLGGTYVYAIDSQPIAKQSRSQHESVIYPPSAKTLRLISCWTLRGTRQHGQGCQLQGSGASRAASLERCGERKTCKMTRPVFRYW